MDLLSPGGSGVANHGPTFRIFCSGAFCGARRACAITITAAAHPAAVRRFIAICGLLRRVRNLRPYSLDVVSYLYAFAAIGAYVIWGLFPLYWRLLGNVPTVQVLAHRAVWCAVSVCLFLALTGQGRWWRGLQPRVVLTLCVTATLIGTIL